jgi:hypothetical protein
MPAECVVRSQAKKKEIFFHGEVFFLLTCPLMDDPFTSLLVFRLCASTADGIGPYFTDEGQGNHPG